MVLEHGRRCRAGGWAAGLLTGALLVSGCTPTDGAAPDTRAPASGPLAPSNTQAPSGSTAPPASPSPRGSAWPTVAAPEPLRGPLLTADLLVWSPHRLSDDLVRRITALEGVESTEQLSLAQVAVQDRVLNVAAVDPSTYRRFTPASSAQLGTVWTRVAGGELAVTPALGRRLRDGDGYLKLGNDKDAARVHVGALVPQVPRVDAVVNQGWADRLRMRPGNALLVSTGLLTAPQSVRPAIQRLAGGDASVQMLANDLDITVQQTAFLTGGSVAAAVGSFSYRVLGGGRIAPDAAWVRANIRTESVPILGRVTCHKVLLPQLRAALTEVVTQGLADKVNPDEYAGCYYPRFIANTTRPSLHAFGIAVDLNVPGNLRGTRGEIDRRVVAIFKKWGFGWGGDWRWTDPMHFELNALVDVR